MGVPTVGFCTAYTLLCCQYCCHFSSMALKLYSIICRMSLKSKETLALLAIYTWNIWARNGFAPLISGRPLILYFDVEVG